jgi:hypothetical protein
MVITIYDMLFTFSSCVINVTSCSVPIHTYFIQGNIPIPAIAQSRIEQHDGEGLAEDYTSFANCILIWIYGPRRIRRN